MALNKKSYFQGGGGVNEPTPGKVKYHAEPAIMVQPRFKEPFYRNYDLYDVEGVDGPAVHGPGSGWNHMDEHDSIKDFLDFRRQRLKGKYVADDFWITENNYKQRAEKMKIRASLLSKIIKTAQDENDGPNFDYGDGAYTAMSEGKKMKTITDAPHKSPGAFFADDNDLGTGFYENLEHYKSVKDFIEHTPLGRDHGAKIPPESYRAKHPIQKSDDNEDHMMPPKEHGTSIYDWKNSPYQGKPKAPKRDSNHIDFPFDDVESDIDSGSIIGDSESYLSPRQLGPAGPGQDMAISPGQVNLGDFESYPSSAQIGGYLDKYLPQNDFEDKPDSDLDVGRDYTDEDAFPQPGRRYEGEDDLPELDDTEVLDRLEKKYLSPAPTHGLFGLPDGVDLPDEDLGDPTDIQPYYGTYGPESTMYEDKWNI